MEKDILFKKATFGGFDREDVMNYISKITDEFQEYKIQTIKTIDMLKEKIAELEKDNNILQERYDELILDLAKCQEIEVEEQAETVPSTTDEIKMIIESLYENINGFINTLSDNATSAELKDEDNAEADSAEEIRDDELLKIIDKYVD